MWITSQEYMGVTQPHFCKLNAHVHLQANPVRAVDVRRARRADARDNERFHPSARLAERRTRRDALGAVRMSPEGFSGSGQTAVAFVDWRRGPTCGHTIGVALSATSDSTWSIAEMILLSSRGK